MPATAGQTFSSEFVLVIDLGSGSYSFTQGGFDNGATITGAFTGTDLDGDFQINSFTGELSSFSASFSGNALVGPWSSNLAFLVFDLNGSNLLGDGIGGTGFEGISTGGSVPNGFFWDVGPGPYNLCNGSQVCGLVGGGVPEPSSWAMLIAGFGLIGATLRRRRAAMA
jgi:hypothetical protein